MENTGEIYSFHVQKINELEKLALQTSNRTISSIENAVATWDAAGEKPFELEPDILRLKNVHGKLCEWEIKMLKSMGRADLHDRIHLLEQFSAIFNEIEVMI